MTNNYVIFDENGLLKDSDLKPISKGNNKEDSFYIAFSNYDYSNSYVTVAITLPDGNSLPELGTSLSDFDFKTKKYKGYKIILNEPITSQAGTLTFTFNLKSKQDNRRLCSSQLSIKIHDTDVPTDPTIDNAQLENLFITLDEDYKELNEKKLDKDFGVYDTITIPQGHESVVVDNGHGVPKRIYLENLYNIVDVNGVEPVDRSITLTASNIDHKGKNIGEEIDILNKDIQEKAPINETVFYRSGSIEGIVDIRPNGVLSHETDTYFSDYHFARVILSDTNFEDGDIITCDVDVVVEGVQNESVSVSSFTFTRVLKTGGPTIDFDILIPDGLGQYVKARIYGTVNNNILGFRIITTQGIYKPTISYSMVRRG
jgi:hypothetical protein